MSAAPARVCLEIDTHNFQAGDSDADLVVERSGKTWHLTRGDWRAEWDRSSGRGKVWQTVNPYAIDGVLRVVHSLLLAEHDGFLLHASSAKIADRAYAFSGVSGAGKTTISRLAPANVTVLTDEISYLKMEDGVFRAWGTPFAGELGTPGPNCWAPLARLFLLDKGLANRVESMSKDEAVCAVMRNVLFFADDADLAGRVLETVCRLVENVPVERLTFRPDREVWDMVARLGDE